MSTIDDLYMNDIDDEYILRKNISNRVESTRHETYMLIASCKIVLGDCNKCNNSTKCKSTYNNSEPWFKRFINIRTLDELSIMIDNYDTII